MPQGLKRGLILAVAVLMAVFVVAAVRILWMERADEDGIALIGGPFSLVDQDGQPVTDATYRGKLMLVYFGFTYCPDVCPTELQNITTALDELGSAAAEVVPVFITVDPERDTPAVLAEYLENFHPGIRGLSGTPEQIAVAARAYRVYYAKSRVSGSDTEYLMDHSAFVYLMDRQGRYLTHFAPASPPEKIAGRIRAAL